jgi:hypothetical protein
MKKASIAFSPVLAVDRKAAKPMSLPAGTGRTHRTETGSIRFLLFVPGPDGLRDASSFIQGTAAEKHESELKTLKNFFPALLPSASGEPLPT